MLSESDLQNKLIEMETKLKIICESYIKLKKKLREKDEEIMELKKEKQKMKKLVEFKENNQIAEMRKKYEMVLPSARIEVIQEESSRYRRVPIDTSAIEQKLKNSKSLSPAFRPLNQASYHVSDQKSNHDAPAHQRKGRSTVNSSYKSKADNIEVLSRPRPQRVEVKQKEMSSETEALILKQLWEERDREIKKMDDLFENLNKRIQGSV